MTNQAVTINTNSPVRRQLDALNATETNETLLACWMHLCRTEVEGDDNRRARAIAMDSIENELVVMRGMTHEQFSALHMAVWEADES